MKFIICTWLNYIISDTNWLGKMKEKKRVRHRCVLHIVRVSKELTSFMGNCLNLWLKTSNLKASYYKYTTPQQRGTKWMQKSRKCTLQIYHNYSRPTYVQSMISFDVYTREKLQCIIHLKVHIKEFIIIVVFLFLFELFCIQCRMLVQI